MSSPSDRFDWGTLLVATTVCASIPAPLALGGVWSLAALASGDIQFFATVSGLALGGWAFSLPVWLVGVTFLGLPGWAVVRRLGGGSPEHAAWLGGASAALVCAVIAGDLADWTPGAAGGAMVAAVIGGVSGAIGGLGGLRIARRCARSAP